MAGVPKCLGGPPFFLLHILGKVLLAHRSRDITELIVATASTTHKARTALGPTSAEAVEFEVKGKTRK